MSLSGKTALVTGSTSGIGLGIAMGLADRGVRVIFNGFGDPQDIHHHVAAASEKSGQDCFYLGEDLSEPQDIQKMMGTIETRVGGVDILVNNAGIQHVAPIDVFPQEKWDQVIAINLSSAFHTMKGSIPWMRQRKWGRIINIASAHGLVASAQKAAYVAAKHGLVGLTKVAALETAKSGITVNALCPGWVLTPLVQKQIEEKAAERAIPYAQAEGMLLDEKQPSHRFVTPGEITAFILFLCGEDAASITGAALSIDGGWTAQ